MRRICCLLLCLSLLLISAACRRGGGTEDGSDAAQLRIGALHTDLGSGADYVSYLENAARAYCQANEGVEIEVIDYGAVRDADALLRLNSELASGNGPDLLLLDGMPYERYARQGLLLDLNPYLDSGAGGLQRSELFAGPLRAMSYDGGLYCLSPRYTLRVNVGLRSLLGDAEIDFARLVELWNQRPESMVMLSATMDNSALALLNTCLTGAQALGFLDKGAATCAFDDPRFLEILELCASLPQAAAREQTGEADMQFSSYLLLAEQQALFYPALISYPEQYIELLTGLNGDLRSFGEPGLGEDGVVCQLQLPLAITSASQNPDAAWAFLVYMVRRCGVEADGVSSALPLLRENLDEYMTNELGLTGLWTLYEQGDETVLEQMRLPVWNGTYTAQIDSMPYTREVYDQLLALIDHATVGSVGYATTVYSLYQDVENIVREEALIYFAGDASVEEAAARMQQRASTLLAEQD